MVVARGWNPETREYEPLTVIDGNVHQCDFTDVPSEWTVEYGFINTNGERIYHGDVIFIPWTDHNWTVIHYASTKLCVPMFLYDRREPKYVFNPEYKTSEHARPAYLDSRIRNLGSCRAPTTRYAEREKPEPQPRVDIYARIKEKN